MQAQTLADDDARAFDAVMAAYQLPSDDPGPGRRDPARPLAGAIQPPLRTAALAAAVIHDGRRDSRPGANVNVLSDVSVAASAARAALEAAAVNVEINLAALRDPHGVRGH